MMDELKRCPFCGGEGTHKLGEVVVEETVFCLECEIAIKTEIWQKRDINDDLIRKLRDIRDKSRAAIKPIID